MSSEDLECTVCLEPFNLGLRAPMILSCGGAHELCFTCVNLLRANTERSGTELRCPTCRSVMEIGAPINRNRGLLAALEALQRTQEATLKKPPPSEQSPPQLLASGVECIDCHRELPKNAFSKAQLKKKSTVGSRCGECVSSRDDSLAAASTPELPSSPPHPVPTSVDEARTDEDVDVDSLEQAASRARSLGLMTEADVDQLTDELARGSLSEAAAVRKVRGLVQTAQHAAFAGKRVRVRGLSTRTELNGCVGRVAGYLSARPGEETDSAFSVELEESSGAPGSGERFTRIQSANLEVVAEEASPAERPPPRYDGSLLSVALDTNLPEMQPDFAALATVCTECGVTADDSPNRALSRCGKCKRVQYCSRECQVAGWKRGGHKHSCGQPLPTPRSVRDCPAEALGRTLAEFGCSCPQIATACMTRAATGVQPAGSRFAKVFGTAAGVASVERAMRAFLGFPGVQLTALPILMLVGERCGVSSLLGGEAIALTVRALAHDFPIATATGYPAREIVATNALALLKNLYMEEDYGQVEVVKRALVGAGGVVATCAAMRAFPSNLHIQEFGLAVLFISTANEYTAKEQAKDAGALAMCVAALRRHRHSGGGEAGAEAGGEAGGGSANASGIERRSARMGSVLPPAGGSVHPAAGAIRNITVGEDQLAIGRKQAGVRAGAVAAVCEVIRSPEVAADEEDVEMCISALLNLFSEVTARAFEEQLRPAGGIRGLLRGSVLPSLKTHAKAEGVLMFGMSALNTFTLSAKCGRDKQERCRQAMTDGGVAALVSILRSHPRHETLRNGSLATLLGWYEASAKPPAAQRSATNGGDDEACPVRVEYIEAGVLTAALRVLKTTNGCVEHAYELIGWLMKTHPGGMEPSAAELSEAVRAIFPDPASFRRAFANAASRASAGS